MAQNIKVVLQAQPGAEPLQRRSVYNPVRRGFNNNICSDQTQHDMIHILNFLFLISIWIRLQAKIAPNVPAVYDVFAVAIKEREAFQQP